MAPYREITQCRMTGSKNLVSILDLGDQALTGVFPKSPDAQLTCGPVELVFCPDGGLVQLRQSYDLSEMFGMNYGYRSGLNQSMVTHLENKVQQLAKVGRVSAGDIVVDIGSNDATLLKSYPEVGQRRIGIDPSAVKFLQYYPQNVELVPDFFSADAYRSIAEKPAKVVTSIAMFYDLEDPLAFVKDIASVLDDDGIWHFEQSYLPLMLEATAYDTVCHEHLEYYALAQIEWMLNKAGLRVIDVGLNDINGGSFAVTAAKIDSLHNANEAAIQELRNREDELKLHTLQPYEQFRDRVHKHRDDLVALVKGLRDDGKQVFGYGASTKGNVLLQFCGFTTEDIPYIAEINPDKFGCFTPGTNIPIVSESEAKALRPDYFLVLPWHFRPNLVQREKDFLRSGGKMIFPLPQIDIVSA